MRALRRQPPRPHAGAGHVRLLREGNRRRGLSMGPATDAGGPRRRNDRGGMGHRRDARRLRAEHARRRGVRPLVGAVPAPIGEPGDGQGGGDPRRGSRHQGGAAGDLGAHTRRAPQGRLVMADRGRPLHRRAYSGCRARRNRGRRPLPVRRRRRRADQHDRTVPDRPAARARPRAPVAHRPLHRHRRLDRGRAPSSATAAGAGCSRTTTGSYASSSGATGAAR